MRILFTSAALLALSGSLQAQTIVPAAADIKGHRIGESIAQFLSLEPEAQQEVYVCRQHPTRPTCDHLIAALDRGQRAEISNSDSMDFVLDGAHLVKLTLLMRETTEHATDALTQKFGVQPKTSNTPGHNSAGMTWQNRLFAWDTTTAYATLYEDNNPALQDHQPLLIIESQSEHLIEQAEAAKSTHTLSSQNLPQ